LSIENWKKKFIILGIIGKNISFSECQEPTRNLWRKKQKKIFVFRRRNIHHVSEEKITKSA